MIVMERPADQAATLERAWQALAGVCDPEIPAISIVDLGLVRNVTLSEGRLEVELLPTFIGCPALDMIRANALEALEVLKLEPGSTIEQVGLTVSFAEPWTADRISPTGRAALRASGFAPPALVASPDVVARATCPYCGSRRTVLENAFGPTRCRSIHYCTDCRQPFEQFKDI